jgi:hypothetical protein
LTKLRPTDDVEKFAAKLQELDRKTYNMDAESEINEIDILNPE